VLSIVGQRQYVDWRSLRHRDVREPAVREAIKRFYSDIASALREPWVPPEERRRQEAEAKRRADKEEKRRAEAAHQVNEKRVSLPPAPNQLDPRVRPIKSGESLKETLDAIMRDDRLSPRDKVDSYAATYAWHKEQLNKQQMKKLATLDQQGKIEEGTEFLKKTIADDIKEYDEFLKTGGTLLERYGYRIKAIVRKLTNP